MYRGINSIIYPIFCIAAILSSCTKDAKIGLEQSQSLVKFFGGSKSDAPSDIIEYNNGYAITGTMKSDNNVYKAFVILTDKYGNETSTKTFPLGGIFDNIGNRIIALENGDLLIVGTINVDADGDNTDIWVSRIQPNGSLVWSITNGENLKEEGLFASSTPSGSFIVGGYTESSGNGGKDVYILKLDRNGNVEWSSALGGANNDVGYDIIERNDTIFLAGYTESFSFADKKMDIFLAAIDNSTGKVFFPKMLGSATNEKGIKLVSLPNNDFIVLAQAYDNTLEPNHIILYRTSSTFIEKWNKSIPVTGTYSTASDLLLYNSDLYIIGTSFKNQNFDFLIHKMDINGNLIFSKTIPSVGNQVSAAGLVSNDGIPLYVGATVDGAYQEIVLIKGL